MPLNSLKQGGAIVGGDRQQYDKGYIAASGDIFL